jgi:predicted outer membrane repeat protein
MLDHRVVTALLVLCGMLATPADAATCRVTTTGSPGGDGSDWGAQAKELNSALGDAACTEIWVASGVYNPITPANPLAVTLAEQRVSFSIDRALSLYGGFNATETELDQRDPEINLTVLSGDIDGNDVVNADGITENTDDIVGANSFHVLWVDGATENGAIDQTTRIDGFVITAGLADDTHPWNPGGRGGGLYCNGEGGECSPSLTNLRFVGNHAYYSGGALYNRGVNGISSPLLDRVRFVSNTAGQVGGAMHNDAQDGISSPQLGDVSFIDNHANASGGAIYSIGMYGTSSPEIVRVTFDNNSAMDEGGAVTSYGLAGSSEPHLTNVTFHANAAHDGGAMFNHARSDGIGSPLLRNVTFHGNTAENNGGAIYNEGLSDGVSATSLVNVILWGDSALNLGAEVFNNSASPNIRDSIVAGGCPPDSDCSGGGIIDADPLLGPLQDNGGATHTLLPGTEGSAIDAGDNASCASDDQRGLLRPQGAACDIGAVELLVPVTVSVSVSGMGSASADSFPLPVSGTILDCRASNGTNCSADYPGLSEVALLLVPDSGWTIGSVNGCNGSLAGSVYTTDPVSGNCSVAISFELPPEIFADGFETQ